MSLREKERSYQKEKSKLTIELNQKVLELNQKDEEIKRGR